MSGSSLALAAVVLFVLSLSATPIHPTATTSKVAVFQGTSAASVASAKDLSGSQSSSSAVTPASPASQESDALKGPLPAKKRKLTKDAHSKEGSAYKNWADEEVRWIITDEEREAFKLKSGYNASLLSFSAFRLDSFFIHVIVFCL